MSEHFIEASRVKLQQLMERRLDKKKFYALLVDATPFEGQQMVAALGSCYDGTKMIVGIWQGATENATVMGELFGDLMNRGLDFAVPRIYVLDGGKTLHSTEKKYAGELAPIQQCQVHKRRNVPYDITDETNRSSRRWGQNLTAAKVKGWRWLESILVGRFEFAEWTGENHLRHTRFIGLRDDTTPTEVRRETSR